MQFFSGNLTEKKEIFRPLMTEGIATGKKETVEGNPTPFRAGISLTKGNRFFVLDEKTGEATKCVYVALTVLVLFLQTL